MQHTQFTVQIVEDLEPRNRGSLSFLGIGNDAADHLQDVIKHHAQRCLEDHRFRSAADQVVQMEDFGDLLKNLFDAPAKAIEFQKVIGGVAFDVEQVGDDH